MKNYCKRCRSVFGGGCCPVCHTNKVAPVSPEDLCFLTEQPSVWSGVVEDALNANHIPFSKDGRMGEGLALIVGPGFERFRYCVPYACLEQATELIVSLLGEDSCE